MSSMRSRTFLKENKSLHSFGAHRPRAAGLSGLLALALLAGCGTHLDPGAETGRHITEPPAAPTSGIPQVVTPLPLVEPPQPEDEPELYTVVVQDQPVRQVLFEMARGYGINIDVNPDVTGTISMNAIDQTLPQILERISRQVDVRWRPDEFDNIVVEADSPFWHVYQIDYVNVARTSTTDTQVSTSIGDGVGSTATLNQTTSNDFWTTLPANINALLTTATVATTSEDVENVIANPASGVVSVRGTTRQHEAVAEFLNDVQTRSLYQVLIQATVVEVRLSDDYQAGVDWQTLDRNNGEISFFQYLTPTSLLNVNTPPTNILTLDRSASPDAISATIAALSQFGESRVLSSPTLMTLNNQPAILRRVDNTLYFSVEVTPPVLSENGNIISPAIYTSTANTVPVGFVMPITPQISADDQVTLYVRPTISRITGFKQDPNPVFSQNQVPNDVPETQVSEMEAVLKLYSGQVGILGGLMQDSISEDQDGLPVLSRLPGLRNLFGYRQEVARKTELIIFIRPVIVRQPSLQGDLSDYQRFLPANGLETTGPLLPEGTLSLPGGD